jgi:hypothetical protein
MANKTVNIQRPTRTNVIVEEEVFYPIGDKVSQSSATVPITLHVDSH